MAGPRPDAYRSVAHSTVTVDGKIYAIGGASSPEEPQAVVEVYDPATDAWEAREAMPDAAGYFGLDAIDRRIYRVGGLAVGGPSDRLIAYDIDADTWTDLEPLPVSAAYVTATTLDGKLYAVGGATTDGDEGVLLSTVHRYDPVADEWTDVAPLPSPRAFHRAAAAGGKLYIWNAAFGVGQAAEGEQIAFENRCAGHDGGRCIDASSQSIAAFPLNEKDGLLSRSFEEPQGENCPRGGIRVDAGRDIDGDGQLSAMKRPPPPSFAMASTAIEESTVPMGSMAGMASAVPRAAPVVPLPLAEPGRAPSSSLPESQPCSFPAGDEEA